MKESRFIAQNSGKWKELENMLQQGTQDPGRMSELFVEVTDDLSFAKTYYPHRIVRAYLNNVSQNLYQNIYKNKSRNFLAFKIFWQIDLPLSLWHARHVLIVSFCIFLVGLTIGIISCINDPSFATKILGAGYVEQTMENIASGDPMAIYKDDDDTNMFLGITWNNLRVSFRIFISGILFGAGTILYLMMNAVMVGTFQFFFWDKGVFGESFITIWQHGTIEISCLVIAAAAGLTLAKGLIFPGTYPRMQAMQISAIKGLTIMAGVAPLIILAGFIEAFITRLTEAPIAFRIFVLLASAILIVWYFIIYPYKVAKSEGFPEEVMDAVKKSSDKDVLPTGNISQPAEVIMQTLAVFRNNFTFILKTSVFTGVSLSAILVYLLGENEYFNSFASTSGFESIYSVIPAANYFEEYFSIFAKDDYFPELAVMAIIVMISAFLAIQSAVRVSTNKMPDKFHLIGWLILQGLFFSLLFLLPFVLSWLLFFLLLSVAGFINGAIMKDPSQWNKGFIWYFKNWFQTLSILAATFIICLSIQMLTAGAFVYIIMEFIQSNFVMNEDASHNFFHFFMLSVSFTAMTVGITIIVTGAQLQFLSISETQTAAYLRNKYNRLFHL
jgi:uncharacterized membrane protein SpoIIM required for sporulation